MFDDTTFVLCIATPLIKYEQQIAFYPKFKFATYYLNNLEVKLTSLKGKINI